MYSRERVLAAIELNKPDRCPIAHNPTPVALLKYGEKLIGILNQYPPDVVGIF